MDGDTIHLDQTKIRLYGIAVKHVIAGVPKDGEVVHWVFDVSAYGTD